ncbi:MAG TPA: helix-turn-helix domain-containing protein [Pirellulales bacterium]
MSTATTGVTKLLLTADEAAESLSVCRKTLYSMTVPRGPLPCVKVGRAVRYSVASIEAWIRGQEEASAVEASAS